MAPHSWNAPGVASGPFSWLNPTTRRIPIAKRRSDRTAESGYNIAAAQDGVDGADASPVAEDDKTFTPSSGNIYATKVEHKWRSRDNRKGRHAIAVTPAAAKDSNFITPPSSSSPKQILKGIWRMFCVYPYWDVSWLVAVVFTLGSLIWCINAFFDWLPLQDPSTEFSSESLYAGGITAFIGATVFEIGSVLLMIEAVNENRSDCFGWALEEALESGGLVRVRSAECSHHHKNRKNFVGKGKKAIESKPSLDEPMTSKNQPGSASATSWTWWPTWYEMHTHYLKEIGFLACLAQFIGATIFWVSGFTALPGIQNKLSTAALDGAFWAPQVVGGAGFIVSGILFMLETQKNWYTPALTVLGWHIGAWNLIGAVGFTLCGALGYSTGSGEVYESSLATFWGSWAFLIGSVIQWYESLDKYPVDIEKTAGTAAKSRHPDDE